MNKDNCISLELSKMLKKRGVEQSSLFYWRDKLWTDGRHEIEEELRDSNLPGGDKVKLNELYFSAFTSTELGEMLPNTIMDNGEYGRLTIVKFDGLWSAGYLWENDCYNLPSDKKILLRAMATRLPEALGRVLNFLILKDLLDVGASGEVRK